MNLYELMSGNLQTAQSSSVFQFNARPERNTPGSRDVSSFSAILGTKLSGSERKAEIDPAKVTASVKKPYSNESAKTADKPKYMTFQEANANVRKIKTEDAKTTAESTSVEPESIKEESAGDRKKNVETDVQSNFINICAELLGVDKGELQKLLDQAGISVESLKDADGIKKAVDSLSQLMGLNSAQTESLRDLFAMVSESLGMPAAKQTDNAYENAKTEVSGVKTAEEARTTDTEVVASRADVQGKKAEPDETPVSSDFIDKFSARIGAKLDEIKLQADNDNSTVQEELKKLMQPLLEKAETAAKVISKEVPQEAGQEVKTAEAKPAEAKPEVQAQAAATSDKDAEKDSDELDDGGKGEQDAKTVQKAAVSDSVQTAKAVPAQVQFQNVQENRQVVAAAVEKAPEVPLKPSELISQIVEKAKVVLTPEKSEMAMDLKPDSLGKLSLKVVTENGIVMAKFVAENQQVREILEANMQLLKDSLEKQGMNVQGFSVSVRQDQSGSDSNRQQYRPSGNLAARNVRNVNAMDGQTTGILEANTSSSPYRWENSTIDLSA